MTYIPFYKPHLPITTFDKVKEVLESGWLTTGPKVQEFETEFGKLLNSKHNIAVSSCTAALHLAYMAHNIGPKDEVIVPSFTFCSTINAIVHVGAIPIFCDIDEKTLCIDPEEILKKITKKTKAIVVVHYAGMPADMDKINKIARDNELIVIEDAAHAFLTKYIGKYIGTGNNTTCFSFYATKNLTTGEGGMVTTNNRNLAEYFQLMRLHGISKSAINRYSKKGNWQYDVIAPGYKYNMTDMEATIGIEQIKRANTTAKRRQHLALTYKKFLNGNKNILLPEEVPYEDSQHSWHLFTVRLKDSCKITRDALIEGFKEAGIGTSVHFIPNHLQSYYKNLGKTKDLSVTEKVSETILSLPFYENLTIKQTEYISSTLNKLTS